MKKKIIVSLTILIMAFAVSIHADTVFITPSDDMYTDVEHSTLPPENGELWVAEFQPAGHFERIMIKFDIEQLTGQTIESASLNLNRFLGCPQGGTTTTDFYAITEDWNEETWNPHSHAQYDNYVWATYGFNVNGWHSIDLTQLVQNWIDNGLENYGLLIRAQTGSKFSKFYSKEHSNSNLHPYLEVNYTPVYISESSIHGTILNIQNYPNPFNPSTTISFEYSNEQNQQVELEIFNIKGERIKTFEISPESIREKLGINKVFWNGKDENYNSVSSGIYFYRIRTANSMVTKKMILLR
ncbi:MAG: DNRLRE domain-containing protein [Candidatus Cloacimonetes bacterium]|nr:DNRLRE domain-containing protein [Candidatus Cloacimonadota bacterium]